MQKYAEVRTSFSYMMKILSGFPGGPSGKELTCQYRRHKRCGFDSWSEKIPWRRAWQPTPVFLPGESYGQRSLVSCSIQGHIESDTTEVTACIHVPNIYQEFTMYQNLKASQALSASPQVVKWLIKYLEYYLSNSKAYTR